MRTRRVLLIVAPLLVVAGGAVWFLRKGAEPAPRQAAGPAPHRPSSAWLAGLVRPGRVKGLQVDAAIRREKMVPAEGGEPTEVVRLRPDQVLAQVNGVAIGLADLGPAGSGGEMILDPEMFRFLLDRAIDRELVFQAAASQDLALTAEEEAELARVRASMEQGEPGVIKQLTRTPEQIEFDLRDTAGLMLQTDLLTHGGAAPNVTTEMVLEYYKAHESEFAALPRDPQEKDAAWQKIAIEIRQRLGPETQAAYQEAARHYLEELRRNAEVAKADPS